MTESSGHCPYCTQPLDEKLVCESCGFQFERCGRCGALAVAGVSACPRCHSPLVPPEPPVPPIPFPPHRGDVPVWIDPLGIGSRLLTAYFIVGAVFSAVVAVFMYREREIFRREFSALSADLGFPAQITYYYDAGLFVAVTALVLFTMGAIVAIVWRRRRKRNAR